VTRCGLCVLLWLAWPLAGASPAARIRDFLNASPVARTSFWGISIVDLEHHRVVFERNAQRLFLPASNAKLFTTSMALMRLGADYRFQTRVLAPAAPGPDGCVDGLRLVGGGDPNLSGRTIPYRVNAPPGDPLAAIDDLAGMVAAHGVRCVTGDVIGDDTAYVWEPYPEGWDVADPVWDYGAAVSALSIDDNTLTVTIKPGAHDGDGAQTVLSPPVDYYTIDNRVRSGGAERHIAVDRLPGARELRLWGNLPLADPGDDEVLGIDDPALYAAAALRATLERHGVVVHGGTRARHCYPSEVADLARGPACDAPAGVELARHDSAPLIEDLRITDKVSQNLHAEMALLAVARARRQIGSREAGLAELQAFLDEAGLDRTAYTFADGSGLSRLDMVSPSAVVQLLTYLYRSSLRGPWIGLLPVGGLDGTLHARFSGARMAGKIFAKTGSLSHVSALCGYAQGKHGMLAFSILVNNFNRPMGDVRAVMDHICGLMLD